MKVHKKQSKRGIIPVNFTVVYVSYHLYDKIECKYYDPYNDNIKFDEELFTNLTKNIIVV